VSVCLSGSVRGFMCKFLCVWVWLFVTVCLLLCVCVFCKSIV